MPFKKVHPKKVSAVAAEQIIEAIKYGSFPVGSKLPSEFELAEQMGVSRPSIREALSALQAVGLIESKPGSGSYVRKSPSSDEEESAPHLIESEAGCLDVMEARKVLEPPIAALVAQKRTNEHLADLEQILRQMRARAKSGNFIPYFKADKEFHFALAKATRNQLITAAVIPLINSMDQKIYREFTHHYYLKNVSDLEQVVKLHSEILDAIVQGNPELSFERMSEHWRRMHEIWEA
ncbi:FadR family transcriptional regulator [Candidatus Bipolaricaulota bacterium]|nr:FadR family transcriptional regulator [Candidatus Bipolaricaulota bacterium]